MVKKQHEPAQDETAVIPAHDETAVIPAHDETAVIPAHGETAVIPAHDEPAPEPVPTAEPVRVSAMAPAATPAAAPAAAVAPAYASAPAATPQQPQAQQPQAQQPQAQQQYQAQPQQQYQAQPQQQQPSQRTPSAPIDQAHPFAGVTAGDYLRDASALLFLLVSLALRWDFGTDATDRTDVVLITILSMASLAVPAMARFGALGQGWTRRRIRLVRLLANAPYLVMAVIYLVLDMVRGGDLGREGGVGVALGVGLAGALLAAQPRDGELDGPRSTGKLWGVVLLVIGALVAVGATTSVLVTMIRVGDDLTVTTVLTGMILLALVLVLVAWPVLGTVLQDGSWRLVLLALGGAAPLFLVLANGERLGQSPVESLHLLVFGTVLWAAAAAAAVAPPVRLAMHPTEPRARWLGAARRLLLVAVVTCVLQIALVVVWLVEGVDRRNLVFTLVLLVIYLIAALIARGALAQGQPHAAPVAYVVAGGLFLLGLINLAVTDGTWTPGVTYADLVLALVVPFALAVMVGMAGGRQAPANRTTLPPQQQAQPQQQQAQPQQQQRAQQQPQQQQGQSTTTTTPYSIQVAMDPNTSAATLAELATNSPESRPYVARHRNAYPGLLQWLGGLGDPAVDQALRERGA